MKRMTLFFGIPACTLAVLVMAQALPMMAGDALAQTRSGVYVLLSRNDPPIHIGDGEGEISDLEFRWVSFVPPDLHAWTFELVKVPGRITFMVTIFSLVPNERVDCPTTAWVNGKRVYDLRQGENVGFGKTTTAQFSVGKRQLKVGRNTVEIREEWCTNTNIGARNDSLIKELTYVLDSVSLAKTR